MKKIQLLGLPLLFICLIACGPEAQNKSERETKNGWKSFDESDYSIQYPENWELDKSGRMGMNLVLMSKQSSQQDNFKENVNLVIQDLKDQNMNLDNYVELSEGQIKTMLTNSVLIESKRKHANESEFHKVIFTGVQGIYNLKFEQYYFIKNGKAYVLTLTCEEVKFEDYKETGEEIMNSFRLKT